MDSRVEWLLDALLNGENIDDFEPRSRLEKYLEAVIEESGADNLDIPRSRLDALLYEMADRAPEAHANAVEEGRTQEWSDFWDVFQHNGEPFMYLRAFTSGAFCNEPFVDSKGRTRLPLYKPKYPIKTTYPQALFHTNANITDTLVDIEIVAPLKASNTDYFFYNCSRLKTIKKIKIQEGLILNFTSTTFQNCSSLENITFEGFIGPNINLQWSPKLTHDSLMSVINALRDYSEDTSGTTHTLNISATNIAKLTADELLMITQKGWTYK